MDLDRAEQLLRLAVDPGTTEEERRTAAMALARTMHDSDFFPAVRKVVDCCETILRIHNAMTRKP